MEPGESADGALALPPPAANAAPVVSPPVLTSADATVYSVESPGVQPPVIYSPKLPPIPPADPTARGTNTMELLIDEAGAVQHARLTSTPMRMSDMMLLSPAKTWKFHPALKDGRPVKYRLTMSWVVAPP
jgi:outer membrane biosynthesis protein TonB